MKRKWIKIWIIMDFQWRSTCTIITYISCFLLWAFLIFTFHFWFRDLLRELVKKYEILLIIFFLVFLLFLISEGLLFVSFFWTSFHSLSSPTLRTCPPEGFYLPGTLFIIWFQQRREIQIRKKWILMTVIW